VGVYAAEGDVPILLASSGSPLLGPEVNSIGRLAVAETEMLEVSVGTNHFGDAATSGRASPEAWLKGANE
jgi:hypothetical protein